MSLVPPHPFTDNQGMLPNLLALALVLPPVSGRTRGYAEDDTDVGLRLQVRFGLDGRRHVFQGVDLVASAAWQAADRLRIQVDAGLSLYSGGIGTDRRLVGWDPAQGWQMDTFCYLSVGSGDGAGDPLPVALSNLNVQSALFDRQRRSCWFGMGFNTNSANDILGTQAMLRGRMNDFAIGTHNDCGMFSVAGSDQAWTGGVVAHVRVDDHLLLAFGHEVFTGCKHGLLEGNPAGAWGRSVGTAAQDDHYLFNRAISYIEMADPTEGEFVRLSVSGPSFMQNILHATLPSDGTKNPFFLMPDVQSIPDGDFTLPAADRLSVEVGWRWTDGGNDG